MKKSIIALWFGWCMVLTIHADTLPTALPLPAAKAFPLQVKKIDPNTFVIEWQTKDNYFLYSERIKLKVQDNNIATLGTIRFPQTSIKKDKRGRVYTVYRNQLIIPVNILGNHAGETQLTLTYQGCSDEGFCYPPEQKYLKVEIDKQLALTAVSLEFKSTPPLEKTTPKTSTSSMAQIFTNHHWIMTLLIFFGLGLLLSFTPCILPMVPVLSGIIVGHGKDINTRKAFFLSLSYVLSMSITYAFFGAIIALLGANLQISMQSAWAISFFSLIFILLALSMFGFYELRLPNSWQLKLARPGKFLKRGHYIGAAVMGCLSTLILSPCVTAPLIGILTYIAQTGNVFLGSITLFFLSLGMGTPLLLIGVSAGRWLPASGAWMDSVKAFFGVLLIAVAIYLMQRIIPAGLAMGLWASLFIFCGIYAGALTPSISNQEKLSQGVGILLLSYGVLILLGASMGNTNPVYPLNTLKFNTQKQDFFLAQPISTLENIQKLIAEAKAKNTPVMLDFYADWCTSCKIMEQTIFQDKQIQAHLSHFKVIKIDITKNNKANKKIMAYFDVIAPPTFIFFNAQGKEQPSAKIVGEQTSTQFLEILNTI